MAQDFISPTDKAALLAFTNVEFLEQTRIMLQDLGFKSHAVYTHEDFSTSFSQLEYNVVILEEFFNANSPEENQTLVRLQRMPMNARRHTLILLLGSNFQTLNSLQAFQQSVHAVINYAEFNSLAQIIQKVMADNDLFLHNYRDTSTRIAEGRV